jgi:hypothetical protein
LEELSRSDFEHQVKGQVSFWQQALRLQDWIVTIQYWPHDALENDVSRLVVSRNQKSAILVLRYPEDIAPVEKDWPPDEARDYDMSIVHELLHLMYVDMESPIEWAEEQSCNTLSRLLVNMYRIGQPQVPHPSPPAGDEVAHKAAHPGHYM